MVFGKKKLSPVERLKASVKPENYGAKDFSIFGAFSFYLALFTEYVTKGRSGHNIPSNVLGKKQISEGQYFYAGNRIFTKHGVKKMYFVRSLPEWILVGFVNDIRYQIALETDAYNGKNGTNFKSSVNLVYKATPFDFSYTNKRVQGKWRQLTRQYERLEREQDNKSLADMLQSSKVDSAVRRRVESYLYLKYEKENANAGFFSSVMSLELVVEAPNSDVADDLLYILEDRMYDYLIKLGVECKPVFRQANEYQKSFTPLASPNHRSLLRDMTKEALVTDEMLASLNTVEHGTVGDPDGVLMGLDVYNGSPVSYDFTATEDANNILLTAATGRGKSGMAKMLFTYLAKDPQYNCVIYDYEGSEYRDLANIMDAQTVSFDSSQGSYVNTLVIDDPVGIPEIDDHRYDAAVEATTAVFNLLFDEEFGMDRNELAIFGAILQATYARASINKDDPKTWGRSKALTYFHFYDTLDEVIEGKYHLGTLDLKDFSDDGVTANTAPLRDFRTALQPYFSKSGAKSHWFKTPISPNDLVHAKNVRFTFNMGKGSETGKSLDNVQLALRQMFAGEIHLKKARYNRAHGIYTVAFLEELQRYLKLRYSGDLISKFVTGGRKLNMVNFLITNAPMSLIKAEKSYTAKDSFASDILGNISTYLIGALDHDSMQVLMNRFSALANAGDALNKLVDVYNSGSKDGNPLSYTFFAYRNNESTMLKQVIHPDLAELPLYRTVSKNDDSNDELRHVEDMSESELQNRINDSYDNYLANYDTEQERLKEHGDTPLKETAHNQYTSDNEHYRRPK